MHGILRALSHADYRAFVIGDTVSMNGIWMQRIVVGWTAWELTGSGAWLGFVAFADLFPAVIVTPFAGAAADRWDRLRLLRWTQSVGLGLACMLLALIATGMITIWSLLVLTFALGSVFAMSMPLRMSIISGLVPREDLGTAVAISSIIFNIARFVGPALAGLLIAGWGARYSLAVSTLSYAVFLVALASIPPPPRATASGESVRFLKGIGDGLSYARDHFGIRTLLFLMLGMGIGARPLIELLPGFSSVIFDTGAEGLAALMSSLGIGAILGGVWFASLSGAARRTFVIALGCWGMISTILVFLLAPSIYFAMPALAAMGCCMVVATIGIQSAIQLATEDRMRGRVLSFFSLMLRAGPGVGALLIGAISDLVGLRLAVLGGVMLYAGVSVWFTLQRRRVEQALARSTD